MLLAMRSSSFGHLAETLVLAGALACILALPRANASAVPVPFDRYQVILDKTPFGPPPPRELTEEEKQRIKDEADAAAAAAAAAAALDVAEILPPGLDKIKVTLLSRYRGIPAAGFLDGSSGKPYYLLEGQEFDGILCDSVDLKNQTVTLVCNGKSAELSLWVNPNTTNRADVTSYGQPGGKTVELQSKTDWEIQEDRQKENDAREALREKRRKAREEWEERRRKNEEELAKLTPEERERRLHDINVDLIINNGGPPLPMELDDEDLRKLEEAGFDVPSQEERDEMARERASRRHRFGGPRGFRGPMGGHGGAADGAPALQPPTP